MLSYSIYLVALVQILDFQFCFVEIMNFGCYILKTTSIELKLVDRTYGNPSLKVHQFSKTKQEVYSEVDLDNIIGNNSDITKDENEKLQNDLKEKRELRFALAPNTFRLVISCKSAINILKRLKELYSGDVDQTHYVQTSLLLAFRSYKKSWRVNHSSFREI